MRVLLIFFAVAVSAPIALSWAEENSAAELNDGEPQNTEEAPSAAEAPAESSTPSPVPSPTAAPTPIEPLDAWYERPEVQASAAATPTPEEVEVEAIEQSVITESQPTSWRKRLLPDEKEAGMNKQVKKRWQRLKEARDERVAQRMKLELEKRKVDPRGKVEFRLCSLDLNSLGLKSEVKRFLKGQGAKGFLKKQRGIITDLRDSRCDAIALQGLVGRSTTFAKQGLLEIADKLAKRTKSEWKVVIAAPEKELSYSGFLYRPDRIQYLSTRTYRGLTLPERPVPRGEKRPDPRPFPRALFEVQFRVKNSNGEGSRRFILFSFHLQKALVPPRMESELLRVEMAEILRETAVERLREEQSHDPFDPPVLVLAGEFVSGVRQPAAYVIDGRLRLRDFYPGGVCSITEEAPPARKKAPKASEEKPDESAEGAQKKSEFKLPFTFACSQKPDNQKVFFNPLLEQFPPGKSYRGVMKEGTKKWFVRSRIKAYRKMRREYRKHTAALHLLQHDLELIKLESDSSGRYAVGAKPAQNGLEFSPLLWADFNW